MMNAVRAEWIKLRTIRSTWVLLIVSVVLTLGFAVLLGFVSNREESGRRGGNGGPGANVQTTLVGFSIATLLVGVVSVLLATGDFRFTIRQTLAAEPRRLRVMAAKAIVVTLASALVGAIMLGLSVGVGSLIFKARGVTMDFEGGWSDIIGSWLYLILFSLAGLAVGLLIRHSAGAIVLLLVWPLLVEGILGALSRNYFRWMTKWLPFSAGGRLTSFNDDTALLGRWTGGLYFAAWIAVALAAGAYLLKRRDA